MNEKPQTVELIVTIEQLKLLNEATDTYMTYFDDPNNPEYDPEKYRAIEDLNDHITNVLGAAEHGVQPAPATYTTFEKDHGLLELWIDKEIPQDGNNSLLDQMNNHLHDVFQPTFPHHELDWRDDRTCWVWLFGYGEKRSTD